MHRNVQLIASAFQEPGWAFRSLFSFAFSRFLKEKVFPVKTSKKTNQTKKASQKEKSQVLQVTVTWYQYILTFSSHWNRKPCIFIWLLQTSSNVNFQILSEIPLLCHTQWNTSLIKRLKVSFYLRDSWKLWKLIRSWKKQNRLGFVWLSCLLTLKFRVGCLPALSPCFPIFEMEMIVSTSKQQRQK